MNGRFVVEGTWSGYTSNQRRIVHRTVHKASERRLRNWLTRHSSISYTDGTFLCLSVRDCKPYERVRGIVNGYGSLIRDCVWHDVSSVHALQSAKNRRESDNVGDVESRHVQVGDCCAGDSGGRVAERSAAGRAPSRKGIDPLAATPSGEHEIPASGSNAPPHVPATSAAIAKAEQSEE